MTTVDRRLLDAVFGEDSTGATPEERAVTSKAIFVRSLDQLAFDTQAATGHKLTAWEALATYGWDVLAEVGGEGAALLCAGPRAAGNALRSRRESLGLDLRHVARRAGLNVKLVDMVERTDPSMPITVYEKIGRTLCLDERFLSVHHGPAGNEELVVRLRTASVEDNARLTPSVVSDLAEAAWVALTQYRLERQMGLSGSFARFNPSYNYGDPNYPAFRHGYYLAQQARSRLGLGNDSLKPSLREICENILGIPLIQAELGEQIAGATIQVTLGQIFSWSEAEQSSVRAIIINLSGRNRNVFIRRSTLAHELGHLLYDPPGKLRQLRVDDYDALERDPYQVVDYVEQRANAFGVEFIAPQAAVVDQFRSSEAAGENGVEAVVNKFGISYTAARYHIWNALDRDRPLDDLTAQLTRPSDEWQGKETYTADYHPISSLPPSRSGRFSAVVVQAAKKGAISWNTAAEYLMTSREDVKEQADAILDLFPGVEAGNIVSS
jgi:Zn-dependent peptidase ImmA (M78 family)/transcriptional regulator with XRE-family HTH domain